MAKKTDRITPKNVKKVAVSPKKVKEVKEEVEKPFVCDVMVDGKVCGFRAARKQDLETHQRKHQGEVVKKGGRSLSSTEVENVTKTQKQITIEKWEKEDQVRCYIPLNFGEKPGATHEVCVNGVVMVYPKGKPFTAPKSIVDLIEHYLESVATAGDEMAFDRSEAVEDALTK